MPAALAKVPAGPLCTEFGGRPDHAVRRPGLARHGEGARDIRRQQIAIGMWNDVGSGDLLKILWHDGLGMSLYAKRLERGGFIWPSPADGVVPISAAQLGYMLDHPC
jgi:transposase